MDEREGKEGTANPTDQEQSVPIKPTKGEGQREPIDDDLIENIHQIENWTLMREVNIGRLKPKTPR